jgi:hypothetical protein
VGGSRVIWAEGTPKMRQITLDDYYLTEQDEPTVRLRMVGQPVCDPSAPSPGTNREHSRREIRRRLHVLGRAARVAFAA